MEILVNVIGQKLKIATNLKCFISGSQQFVKFTFNMDDSWDNLTTFAQFRQNGVAYNQYLDANNSVYLPSEIVAGACTLILYGTGGNVRATTNYLTLTIDENILVTNAQSTEITQSLYEQLVDSVTTTTNRLQDRVANVENVIQGLAGGAPIVVSSVSEMTDTDQIYVLSTDGNWYYHNGSAWTAGGEYGAVATDTTLTQAGMPADAGAVGDAIEYLEDTLSVGFPTEAKQALLALLEKVAYVVEDGQDLYDALDLALNPPPRLRSITAAYTQSASVYKNSSLDDLRNDLVVTAHYFDGTTQVVTAYTLSGTLTVGTSTITVTYANKTATFVTTVSAAPLPAAYQRVTYVQSDGNGGVYLRRSINGRLTGDNNITKYSFEVDAQLLDTQPNYTTNILISTTSDCWLGYNTSANAIGVGTSTGMKFPGAKTDRHSYTMHITAEGTIVAERDDGARVTRNYTVSYGNVTAGLFGVVNSSNSSNYRCAAKLYSYKMYFDGELIRDLVPCYRKSDNVVGLYDMANDYFYTPTGGAFTKGADVT